MNKEKIKSVIISVFFSELIALLFLFFSAFFTYNKTDPAPFSSIMGALGLFLGGLSTGVIGILIAKRKDISVPVIAGALYCIVQILCTILWSENDFYFLPVLTKVLTIMCLCIFSALLLKKNASPKRRKHKRH